MLIIYQLGGKQNILRFAKFYFYIYYYFDNKLYQRYREAKKKLI